MDKPFSEWQTVSGSLPAENFNVRPPDSQSGSWNKLKSVALLLAICTGPWTWLYTFKKDNWKLAVGLGLNANILAFLIWFGIGIRKGGEQFHQENPGQVYDAGMALIFPFLLLLLGMFVAWIWAVLDSAVKSKVYLNSVPTDETSKSTALLLAVFTGPWTWLSTYYRDRWKLCTGLAIAYGIPMVFVTLDIPTFSMLFGLLTPVLVWLASLLYTILKDFDSNSKSERASTPF